MVRETGAVVCMDMISEGIIRGVQALLGTLRVLLPGQVQGGQAADRKGCWSLSIRTLGDRIAFSEESRFIDPVKADTLEKSLLPNGLSHRPTKRLEIERIESIGVMDVTTSRPRAASTSAPICGCTTASSSPSRTRWTRSSTGTARRASSSRAARARASTSRGSARAESARGRRHRLGPGVLHARRRRLGRHHQVRRQDPPRGEDGHPRRRPPRHRGVHLVQGPRGEQGPRPARRRLRHGPRRQGHPLDPVPERQQLGARHRRVHAGRPRRRRLGPRGAAMDRTVIETVKARELFRQIAEAAWECADPGLQFDTTINHWHTAPNTGRINGRTRARSTCTSTTRRATSPASTC